MRHICAVILMMALCAGLAGSGHAEESDSMRAFVLLGTEMSSYDGNKGQNSSTVFSTPVSFYGISFYQLLDDYNSISYEARLGRYNAENSNVNNVSDSGAGASTTSTSQFVRDAQALNLDVRWRHTLLPQKSVCDCGPLGADFYFTVRGGFLFAADDALQKINRSFMDYSFWGLGLIRKTKDEHQDSYFELGLGNNGAFNDKYGSSRLALFGTETQTMLGRLRADTKLFFNNSSKNSWRIFIQGAVDMDMGSGPDDMRIMFGVQNDSSVIKDGIGKLFGVSGEDSPAPAKGSGSSDKPSS